MSSPQPAHRLSDVDLERRTATCSVCGPTEIYVAPTSNDGVVKRICIHKVRQRSKDYQQRLRKKKGLPEPTRKPRHRLSEIDTELMRATCSVCGRTDIGTRREGKKHTYYYCKTKQRKAAIELRREHGIPPRNPSHHRLFQMDYEKRTALCSQCGPVRIYVIDLGTRIARRCSNAQIEYKKRALQKNQRFIDEYKVQRGCQSCGYRADPHGLELHWHRSSKGDCKLTRTMMLNKKCLLQEFKKCDVLCAEHHRLLHP